MAIISIHHPLAFTFGILGNIISISVYLAPVPTFYRIWRKKSIEGFQSLPYLVALFSSMLWLYYAMLKKDAFLLITINSFGCVIETIYIAMYLTYAPKEVRVSTVKLLVSMNMALFSFILLLTHYLVGDSVEVSVLGWINVAVSVCVFAAPLSIIAQVIRTKSVEFMPFTLSFCLTLSAVMWFAYGLFTKDVCVALPNVIGFVLGLAQMLLYAIYRNSKAPVLVEKKLPEELKSIVVLSATLGACEVIPVDVKPKSDELAATDDSNHDQKDEKSVEANSEDPKPNDCSV